MTRYRDHRGSLEDSLETLQHFNTKRELVAYLNQDFEQYGYVIHDEDVEIKKYGDTPDTRMSPPWNTYLVTIRCNGSLYVTGYTDGPLE